MSQEDELWAHLYVYGAGGHGKVVADILLASGALGLAGFLDDRAARGTPVLGMSVVGDACWLEQQAAAERVAVALGIGDNHVRCQIATRCLQCGARLVTAAHPRAVLAASASVDAGAVIMAGAVLNPDAQVGAGAIINTCAVIEHDVVVGEYAHLSPNAATGGAARVGAFAHVGLGAVILPGVSVGRNTVVGAGAAVIRDLPDNVVAVGVPARVIGTRPAREP